MKTRPATPNNSATLTEISFSSKNYWNYPKDYFQIWKNELTITEHYINRNFVQVAEANDRVVGYYSVVELDKELEITNFTMQAGIWLEHLFIQPEFIGQGYGKQLMHHLIESAQAHNWHEVKILADPHSRDFYKKLGATYIKDVASNIPGRTVSYFEWSIDRN